MKPLSLLFSLGISLPMFPALAQPPALPRCNPNGNQLEMNACADQAREEADFELNSVYLEIQRRHAGDALFLENLSEAQGRWLAFRDAELAALFPLEADENPRTRYGSMFRICHARETARLTRERIAQLRQWLDGLPEGSACSGSRPSK